KSCEKAQGSLEQASAKVRTAVDAKKVRHGRADAIALARSARTVLAARGKNLVRFDMTSEPPDDDTLAAHILGPTGNLKAPSLRVGETLLVGFSEEGYRRLLGD